MVTVDRAEIQVEADLDQASFRAAAKQANSELEKFVGDVEIGADLDDASFLAAAERANFQLRQTLERARIEGDLDTASFQQAVRVANLELRQIQNDIRVGVDVDRTRFTDSIRSASGILRTGFARVGDDSGADFGDRFQRSFMNQLVNGAGSIATAFTRALQGGIISNPAIGIGIVTAIAAVMPLAGTVAAGAFVSAFGAGLVGLGVVFAAQNAQIKSAFSDLGSDLAAQMRQISAPFEATLLQVVATIRRTFDALAPDLAASFADLAPAVSVFVRELGDAFTQLGPAIQPLTDAFIGILEGVGDRLPGLFTNIANSLINLSTAINPDQFAALAVGILQIIPAITNLLAGLAQAQQVMQPWFDAIAAGVARVMPPLQQLFHAFGGAQTAAVLFGSLGAIVTASSTVIALTLRSAAIVVNALRATITGMVNAAIAAWNRLSGGTRAAWAAIRSAVSSGIAAIGGAVSSGWARVTSVTSRAWSTVRGAVSSGISSVRSAVSSGFSAVAGAVSSAWARITSTVSRAVSSVISSVQRLGGAVRSATSGIWNGLTSGLSSAVSTIQGLINSAISAVGRLASAIRSIPSPKVDIPFIPGFASGVRNFAGGLAVVGEQGPELLALPRGSSVFSNQESRRMAAGAGVGGTQVLAPSQTNHITLNNYGPGAGAELLRDVTWSLKYAVGAGVRTV